MAFPHILDSQERRMGALDFRFQRIEQSDQTKGSQPTQDPRDSELTQGAQTLLKD